MNTPIEIITAAAKQYAAAREVLTDRVAKLNDEIEATKRRLLPGIKSAAIAAAGAQHDLRNEIAEVPELFTKPRTFTIHGIKLGFQKGKGTITWTDAAKVCERIRLHLPQQADNLIKVTETPVKPALLNLDVGTLRKLGCTVTQTGDEILIKDASGEVDKLVAKLLSEGAQEAEEAA